MGRQLVGLVSPEAIPIRPPALINDANGDTVGRVTSGTVSPTLNNPIMLAYLDTATATGTSTLAAQVRGKQPVVIRTKLPFVPKRYKR